VRELIAAEPRVANLHVIPLDLKDTIARLHQEETER